MTSRWRTIADMQLRDLTRRRVALALLVGLPMTWYLAEAAAGVGYAVGTGVLAMAWSAAAAPLFAVVGGRNVDQRMLQAGYQSRDIIIGRLLALYACSFAIALILGIIMVAGSHPARTDEVFVALGLTVLVSTSVGWLIAALVPRELEGTLILIGIVGMQVSIPVSGTASLFIPYYGPLRLTDYESTPLGPSGPIIHAIVWSILIGLAALALWTRRVRVWPSSIPVA